MCKCRRSHQRPIHTKMGTWNQHSIIRRNIRIPNHRINQNTINIRYTIKRNKTQQKFRKDIMPPKTKIEKSSHYKEIVDLLLQGKSSRDVSNYLKKQYGEDIGYTAISRFRKNKLDVESEAKTRHLMKQKTEAIQKQAEIESDVVASKEEMVVQFQNALEILQLFHPYMSKWVKELDEDIELSVDKKVKLGLDAIKQELNVWKDEKPEVNVAINNDVGCLFDEDLIDEIINEEE